MGRLGVGEEARLLREVGPARKLSGELRVPGDKSLSHRALMLCGLSPGTQELRGISGGGDVRATAGILRALGVSVDGQGGEGGPEGGADGAAGPASGGTAPVRVGPCPEGGLREPADVLDCGNAGTTMRLLAGLLAGQPFLSVLTGDASLRKRPMARVLEPLRRMGARVDGRDGGRLAPLCIHGGGLSGIEHRSEVASAQVKSCLLLAGLFARGTTVVHEPQPSRDHTERMLAAFGVEVERLPDGAALRGFGGGAEGVAAALRAPSQVLDIPADPSQAAFFAVAASLRPGWRARVPGVGVNPTRDGAFEVLEAAGARVRRGSPRETLGEPVADLVFEGAELRPFEVGGALVPRLVDEIPVLAVLAATCPGRSIFRDAAELRAKESDRVETTLAMLRAFGVACEARADGLVVDGDPERPLRGGGTVEAQGDHRIAMAAAVAALVAEGPVRIRGVESVDTSFPGFFETLESVLER